MFVLHRPGGEFAASGCSECDECVEYSCWPGFKTRLNPKSEYVKLLVVNIVIFCAESIK
jgi:hypothetical protein